ncbi:hypothetical protein [Kitasatospora sp. GP82]|uniref:hypothetical protein n=1 Tax=Kitasatospora sp. GP82 TaxID=3035089 RepID=UPI002473A6CA|nr:hypothetical protein [Kitasatospora sp. GP82]MDH6129220.1 hypothetical protein [Kitasatospora sp. GP82]
MSEHWDFGHRDRRSCADCCPQRPRATCWQQAEDELGPEAVLRLLTLHGSRTESIDQWWGSGCYETLARRAVARAADTDTLPPAVPGTFPEADRFADAAAHHPAR